MTKQIFELVDDTALADTDVFAKEDSAGVATKKISWASIKTILETVYTILVTQPAEIGVAASDEGTDLETGTGKLIFRMPFAMTLTEVRASVTTAPTGSTITVDINENGTSVLSTKLTIDAGEKTSETAITQPVISDSSLADDSEIRVDIDQIGSSVAGTGLKVWLIGTRA